MKKSLLAIAVAAALPALAQAQVTLYGKMDVGLGSIDRGGTAKSITVVDTAIAQTSRLGVRGTEKMDGGLTAMFQIEGAITADVGAAITFNRESWVGIGGGFGEIRLGRTLTPSFHADAVGDIMGYSYFGGQGNWSSGGAGECGQQAAVVGCAAGTQSASRGAYSTRFSNGINWTSPSLSGLVLRAAISFSERDGTAQTTAITGNTIPNGVGEAYDVAALYSAGPLGLAVVYHRENMNPIATGAGVSQAREVTTVSGRYSMGSIAIKGGWGQSQLGSGATNLDLTKTNIGASMKVGVGTVMLAYSMYEVKAGASNTKREANVIGLAYNHPLSKNTSLYATYGQTDNRNANSNFGLWAGGVSYSQAAAGTDLSGFGAGVIHNF